MAEKKTKKTKKKTTKKAVKKAPSKLDLVHIALGLAEQRPWASVTLRDVAYEAGVNLADLHAHFEDKTDILAAFGREIDRKVLENIPSLSDDLSVRDQLFDILMDRFDYLNEHRAALISILHSFAPDPKQAVISAPHLCKSMNWMLEAAGADTSGILGAVKVTGLTGVYLSVLRAWKKDESADLSKTMAALDKSLDRSEKFMNFFGL